MFKKIFGILGIVLLSLIVVNAFIMTVNESKKDVCAEERDKIQEEIIDLKKEKEELQSAIKMLQTDLRKLEGETKEYPAGELYVGIDIPEGRYRIHSGSSNFKVYDLDGYADVNIILGDKEEYGHVKEYIYYFRKGYLVKAYSKFKLTKID